MFTSRLPKAFFGKTRQFATSVSNNGLWSKYNKLLEEQPILTKCLTSAGMSLSADLICQVGFSTEFAKGLYADIKIDWKRAIKFTAIGGVLVAPALHYWYGFLMTKIPGVSMSAVLKRLSFDQLIFAPILLPSFFSAVLLLEGTPEKIPQKLRDDWFSTVMANYAVWVPAQFVNFRFVPAVSQVLFANVVGFFWNIYLSYSCYNKPIAAAPIALVPVDAVAEVVDVVIAEVVAEKEV
jgi:hypothetical protein